MGRVFFYIGIIVVACLLIVGGYLLKVQMKGIPTYETEDITFEVSHSEEKLARGLKLSSMVCNHCHISREKNQLIGRKVEDIDPRFGQVYSSNITQHKEAGIGDWSDADLAYFLRTGVKPNGEYVPAYMPKFPLMSDEDIEAIIVFLKSDHPLVAASPEEPPKTDPSFFTKLLSHSEWEPYPYPNKPIASPDSSNVIAYGEYLATSQLGCFACHSADFAKVNDLNPPLSLGFFGGGNTLYDLDGNKLYSPNITPHETGIGKWTREEFLQSVKYGKSPGNRSLEYPMLAYTMLEDWEVNAIYDYLQTIPPINNKVKVKP
jgi:cytochrome c2